MRPIAPDVLARARRHLLRADPALAPWIRRVGPCGIAPVGDAYRALVRAVVHQQLAGPAARAIEARLHAGFGGAPPTPAALAAAPEETLRAAGLSRTKAATLRGIAQAFAGGTLRDARLRRADDAAIFEAVTALRGVGPWTAHMLLIFGLGRLDVLPVGDFGVRKGAQLVYGLRKLPGADRLEAIAEPWRPWRSVGAWYLWRRVDLAVADARRAASAAAAAPRRPIRHTRSPRVPIV